MESNEIVRAQILQVVKNQLRANKPPETKQTFERLKALGHTDHDATMFIGQCVAVEIFDILKNKKPFDEARYIRNLKKLTIEPFDE